MKIKHSILITMLACSLKALSMSTTMPKNEKFTFQIISGYILKADFRFAAWNLGFKNGYKVAVPVLENLCVQENDTNIKAEALFLLGRTYLCGFGDCPQNKAKGKELIYQASIQTDVKEIQQTSKKLLNTLNN